MKSCFSSSKGASVLLALSILCFSLTGCLGDLSVIPDGSGGMGTSEWVFTPPGQKVAPMADAAFGAAATTDGGFLISGVVDGNMTATTITAGKMYIAQLGASGMPAWQKSLSSSSGIAVARAVTIDRSGNVLVAGYFGGILDLADVKLTSVGAEDVLIAKFTSSGTLLWAKSIGGMGLDIGYDIATDANENVFVTGGLGGGTVDLGSGPIILDQDDAFLMSWDKNGNSRWHQAFVNPGLQQGRGLAVNADGDVILVGESTGEVNLGGAAHINGGGTDCFIARYIGKSGSYLWSNTSSTIDEQFVRDIILLPNGNPLITGRFSNRIDFGAHGMVPNGIADLYLIEFDANNGVPVRSTQAGDSGTTYAESLAVDQAGNVLVAGMLNGVMHWSDKQISAEKSIDAFTVKLDAVQWSPIWMHSYAGATDQFGYAVTADKSGGVLTVGAFQTEIVFGAPNGTVSSTGDQDLYAVRRAP